MSIRRTPLRAVAGFAAVLLAALPVLTQAQPAPGTDTLSPGAVGVQQKLFRDGSQRGLSVDNVLALRWDNPEGDWVVAGAAKGAK
jgi:hypothetical protein